MSTATMMPQSTVPTFEAVGPSPKASAKRPPVPVVEALMALPFVVAIVALAPVVTVTNPAAAFVANAVMPFPFDLNLLPSSKDLAGIEVYAGAATAPPQFASNGLGASCGVVLIWTRDR